MGFDDVMSRVDIGVWNGVAAVITLLASWILWRVARKNSYRLLGRLRGLSEHARLITSRIIGYGVLLTGVGVTLAILGASLQPVLAVALIVIAALALALRGIADNFAAGIIIQTRQPVRLGDLIETSGHQGYVTELNGRSVILRATDGRTIHVPNAVVLEAPIVNYTTQGRLRSEVEVRAAGGPERISDIVAVLVRAAAACPGITDPTPDVHVNGVEPERVLALVRFWHAWPNSRSTTTEMMTALAAALHAARVKAVVSLPARPARTPSPPL